MVHLEDFHRLEALDRDLAELVSERTPMSDLALAAHLFESTPSTAIEDPAQIAAVLAL